MTDCIPYINDLQLEIEILKDLQLNRSNDENLKKQIEEKELLVERCKKNLEKLSNCNIEYRLYTALLSGLNPNKAVEKVANENYINDVKPNSTSGIWNYYNKLKKIIKK